ncbi:MAG: RNA polymerase sigma factor [Bacteroidota bacterium]
MRSEQETLHLIQQAVQGDKLALNSLIDDIQGFVLQLARNMLYDPEDAKDAAQEILIRITTHLSQFEGRSAFRTWCYRIASNHILTVLTHNKTRSLPSMKQFAYELSQGQRQNIQFTENEGERQLLIQEVKISCSQGMLQCLNVQSRMVYILGEILDFNSKEGSYILEITQENFRTILSRTRKKMHAFLRNNCGLVHASNSCRCHKKVDHAIQTGRIRPQKLVFASPQRREEVVRQLDELMEYSSLFRSNPTYQLASDRLNELKQLLFRIV